MKELNILLDTNIIRRLIEGNTSMFKVMEDMKSDGYSFAISDMSLFELLTSNDVCNNPNKLLSILYDFNIAPIYKTTLTDFENQYLDWFKSPKTTTEMKNNLLPSFSFTLSIFLSDLTNAIMLFLANKLTADYTSEFYLYIMNLIDNGNAQQHFERVIKDCYINNKEKLRKRIPKELKDLILGEFTYFNLLSKRSYFYADEFHEEFTIQKNKYLNKSFKEICSEILTSDDIKIKNNEKMDSIDKKFIENYFKNILCDNKSFNINDITDYINFKYGMKYCYSYYTTDYNSLKKYATYFKEKNVLKYLSKIEKTLTKYKFTSWL